MGSSRTHQVAKSPRRQFGPLLKWAGGKRQLLPHLRRFYPPAFNCYIEPFFGSGAVFFDLHAAGRLRGHEAVLIDSNADLIGCYETVRDECEGVACALERLAAAHAADGRAHYEHSRDARAAGLRTFRVPARRAINSNASRRGHVEEYLITNTGAYVPASQTS